MANNASRRRKMFFIAVICCFILLISFGYYHAIFKDNPPGMSYRSEVYRIDAADIRFLYDLTYLNAAGDIVAEQQIFDAIFAQIAAARRYVLLDMFLFNSSGHVPGKNFRDLAGELTTRLVQKTRQFPDIAIDFITDPINSVYGGAVSPEIQTLQKAGINVIYTDLTQLRDSNLLYSPVWRLFFQWFGNSPQHGMLPHPFSGGEIGVTLRSYLMLLNFKANHRKVFTADDGERMTSIITSANPHNGSSAHSNVALRIDGAFWQAIHTAESAVAAFSGETLRTPPVSNLAAPIEPQHSVNVQLLTENEIEDDALSLFESAMQGDRLSLGAFYLSDQKIIAALVRASQRGVEIRIILDPSNDAFGRNKNGIPNQPAAQELIAESNRQIRIRWYATHGEQYHAKFTLLETQSGTAHLLLGSANLTRRNLDNYNLEMNVHLTAPVSTQVIRDVRQYYERLWTNEGGGIYTLDYAQHHDASLTKKMLYKVGEFSGASTF